MLDPVSTFLLETKVVRKRNGQCDRLQPERDPLSDSTEGERWEGT